MIREEKPDSLQIVEGRSDQLDQLAWTDSPVDVVMPLTTWSMARSAAAVLSARAQCAGRLLLIEDTNGSGFIRICNDVYARSRAPFMVYLAQDAFPGRQWLALALHVLQTQNKGLLAFNDGKWFGQLAAFGLVRRTWADGVYGGAVFFPAYRQHYADTELTLIAQQQGQLAFNPNALLMEVDAAKDGKATHPDDKRLFGERKAGGFGGMVTDVALLKRFS